MGTAASITLVLQAVVPAVALTRSSLRIDMVGGTDVPWSPTYDYFERLVRDAFRTIGIEFTMSSTRRGYYPRGGGRVSASISPCPRVLPLQLAGAQAVENVRLVSRCGRLPRHVAERQLSAARAEVEEAGLMVAHSEAAEEQSDSPGSSLLAYFSAPGLFIGADGIGARGKRAEDVGKEAAARFVSAARSGARMDANLADMVLPLLALAPAESRVSVPAVTPHLKTGLQLAGQFTGCRWMAEQSGGASVVTVTPIAR
jgi:RNA 3'-phosphate cyclase